MTTHESRRSFIPLLTGGVVAVSVMLGYAKYRFDRIEQMADTGRPFSTTVHAAPGTNALDDAPAISYREVYVPIDTHAQQGNGERIPLEATLIIRNANPETSLIIKTVELFGEDGKRIRRVTEGPFEVRPFAKVQLPTHDSTKREIRHVNADIPRNSIHSSAQIAPPSHFIVQWGSRLEAEAPLIEAMMVDESGHLLYARPGRDIRVLHPEHPEPRRVPKYMSERKQDRSLTASKWHASLAPEPKYELLRYDSDMGLRAKNP